MGKHSSSSTPMDQARLKLKSSRLQRGLLGLNLSRKRLTRWCAMLMMMGQGPSITQNLDMMAHKILNRDPVEEINKAFKLFDDDNTGRVTFKNLKRVAKELGERLTDEELQEMIDEADRDVTVRSTTMNSRGS